MCNTGIGLTPSIECFKVFTEYFEQDSNTQINVLNKLKEWITSEEKRLNIGVAKNNPQHAKLATDKSSG